MTQAGRGVSPAWLPSLVYPGPEASDRSGPARVASQSIPRLTGGHVSSMRRRALAFPVTSPRTDRTANTRGVLDPSWVTQTTNTNRVPDNRANVPPSSPPTSRSTRRSPHWNRRHPGTIPSERDLHGGPITVREVQARPRTACDIQSRGWTQGVVTRYSWSSRDLTIMHPLFPATPQLHRHARLPEAMTSASPEYTRSCPNLINSPIRSILVPMVNMSRATP
jgi:hypothetical protein